MREETKHYECMIRNDRHETPQFNSPLTILLLRVRMVASKQVERKSTTCRHYLCLFGGGRTWVETKERERERERERDARGSSVSCETLAKQGAKSSPPKTLVAILGGTSSHPWPVDLSKQSISSSHYCLGRSLGKFMLCLLGVREITKGLFGFHL